jgi:methionyl-tRNA formyltransferase
MPEKQKHPAPKIVFVGAHLESCASFIHLVDNGYNIAGLVSLDLHLLRKMSGGTDLASIAECAGIPVLRVKSINDESSIAWIREKAPDVLLVIGWTQLLKDELLRLPRVACLGFHASLLPKYRGRAPVNWAIIHGETETGNTLMVLKPDADTGDIVAQRRIPITDEDDCRTIYEKVGETEVEMLDEVLPMIEKGFLPSRKQDDSHATVMPKRRPEDGRIDWKRSTREIYNWIRALTLPYPGAFSEIDGQKIWIWTSRADRDNIARGHYRPGDVIQDSEGWPLVATGDGWIRIVEAQHECGSRLSGKAAAATFLLEGASFAEIKEAVR